MARQGLTDAQVEQEIKKLQQSPFVKLAKKEEQIRYRRRQYLYYLTSVVEYLIKKRRAKKRYYAHLEKENKRLKSTVAFLMLTKEEVKK